MNRGRLFANGELRFTTRIGLLFGAISLLAILITMAYSMRTAQLALDSEIANSFDQRQRTLESLLENRLDMLEVYLQSSTANRVFLPLIPDDASASFETFTDELGFLFQDTNLAADLDIMFLLNERNELLINAGSPLYSIDQLLPVIRSPIQYTNDWRLVETDTLSVLLQAAPIFDPATIRLRGYLFVGLAISQNRSLVELLVDRADVDALSIDAGTTPLIHAGPEQEALLGLERQNFGAGEVRFENGQHIMRMSLELEGVSESVWLTVGLSENRFTTLYDNYWGIFLLLSGGFLVLLFLAAWLLNWSHSRAISHLTRFIAAIQDGRRGEQYQPGGVVEYNRIGAEMQRMVEDLNVAATVFESADGMIVTDADKVILRVNKAFTKITGYAPADVIGRHLSYIDMHDEQKSLFDDIDEELNSRGAWQGDVWSRRSNGEAFPQWTSITAVSRKDGDAISNYVVTMIDTSQSHAAESRIEQLAFYDQLTDLPNRQLLRERLEKATHSSAQSGEYGALLHIDMDEFKTVNDTRGHEVGDRILARLAVKLARCVRRKDTVARIGGDEFCLIIEDAGQSDHAALQYAEQVASSVFSAINAPLVVGDHEHFMTASIGITLFQGDIETVDDLMKQAELAMYQAKREARNGRRFYNPRMQARVLEYVAIASDMRQGLARDEFVPYFQSQVDAGGNVTGYELLLRWHHHARGVISPREFIPVAEDNGLITVLGQSVLRMACKTLVRWSQSAETSRFTLAVNISAQQLHQSDFVDQVRQQLDSTGADATRLKLELTESMLLEDIEDSVGKMGQLKALGVSFSLDDFGTGYSSLSYLKRLPLDQLKIDQSFVRDLLTDPYDADIARTIVSLANGLGIEVIAEGVETREQRDCLAEYGCLAYQGYFFGRPLPIEELDFAVNVSN